MDEKKTKKKNKKRDIETKKSEKVTVKSGRIKQYFEPVSQRDSNTAVFFGKMEVGKVGV